MQLMPTASSTQQIHRHPGFVYVVIPALLALVYTMPLAQWLLPGINKFFAQSLLLFLSVALIAGLLSTIILRSVNPAAASRHDPVRIAGADFALPLIPLGPAAQYMILNASILSWLDYALLGFGFIAGAVILVILVPALASRIGARNLTFASATAVAFAFINMPALARAFSWHEVGEFHIQLLAVLIPFTVVAFLYRKDRSMLTLVCFGVFAASCIQSIVIVANEKESSGTMPEITMHTAQPAQTPDIFLLTYDSYVTNETMLGYGIDNFGQEAWLQSHGFTLYPGAYSVAASTIDTMGRVFGNFEDPKLGTAGNSPFFHQMVLAGYDTYGIFANDYHFRGVGAQYTHSYPAPVSTPYTLMMAIAEGEFRHNAYFDKPSREEFLKEKRSLMQQSAARPKFLYTHTGPGHSQNSGMCTPDETERFASRLEEANVEMRNDVETVLSSDADAIIIINGDHGPHLTKTCYDLLPEEFAPQQIDRLDIQDRYGTFLAIRWPRTAAPSSGADVQILQDIGPTLLEHIYTGGDFAAYRIPAKLIMTERKIGGLNVSNGIIRGGSDDGLPLFRSRAQRQPEFLSNK